MMVEQGGVPRDTLDLGLVSAPLIHSLYTYVAPGLHWARHGSLEYSSGFHRVHILAGKDRVNSKSNK